jgi:regulator of replication initiation timing
MSLKNQLDSIELKVRKLTKWTQQLRSENTSLRDENARLKLELTDQIEKIRFLKDKLDHSQKALESKDDERSNELREQLDLYIREVDQCIEWLQNA